MGATHPLPGRVGVARARYLALTGRAIGGDEAERIGLIAESWTTPRSNRVPGLAAELAAGPTRAQLALRDLIDDGASRTLTEQLEGERLPQQSLADTRDFLRISAFREKRQARFHGA